MDGDNKVEMTIPDTVGEMIEFLQKFPKDHRLDLYYLDRYEGSSDFEALAYKMVVQNL